MTIETMLFFLCGFAAGFVLAWTVRCAEWNRRVWFVWCPRITRNHDGRRLSIWGFWRRLGE